MDNIEKIYSLLENENISFENKKYLNELKENIISSNRLVDNIKIFFTKIIDTIATNTNYKNENVNKIIYFISYSWAIIILALVIIGFIISSFIKKELSRIGFFSSIIFTIFISMILILGLHRILEFINSIAIIYKLNINIYLRNFIFSFIIYFTSFIIFAIIGIDLDNNEKKNKEIKGEESKLIFMIIILINYHEII